MDERHQEFAKIIVHGLKHAQKMACDDTDLSPHFFWRSVYLTAVCGLIETYDDPEEVREIVLNSAKGIMEQWKDKSS